MQDYFLEVAYNTCMTLEKEFHGHPLIIERKNNKNMYLRLENNGLLHITCPYSTSNEDVYAFLNEKQKWIEKTEKRAAEANADVMTGEDHKQAVWLGVRYAVRTVSAYSSRMVMDEENRIITYYLKTGSVQEIRNLFYKKGNQKLAVMIASKRGFLDRSICAAHHKQIPHITIRYTTSQWGSCTPAHHAISISSRLIHYPSGCLDYVLTHEYAHILVPNHSSDFYKVVSTYMPDWKVYSDRLKRRYSNE